MHFNGHGFPWQILIVQWFERKQTYTNKIAYTLWKEFGSHAYIIIPTLFYQSYNCQSALKVTGMTVCQIYLQREVCKHILLSQIYLQDQNVFFL